MKGSGRDAQRAHPTAALKALPKRWVHRLALALANPTRTDSPTANYLDCQMTKDPSRAASWAPPMDAESASPTRTGFPRAARSERRLAMETWLDGTELGQSVAGGNFLGTRLGSNEGLREGCPEGPSDGRFEGSPKTLGTLLGTDVGQSDPDGS